MKPRKRKIRRVIPFIDRSTVSSLDDLNRLGARLQHLSPERFERLRLLAEGWVALYDHPGEFEAEHRARLDRINNGRRAVN